LPRTPPLHFVAQWGIKSNEFLKAETDRKKEILNSLLWNASIENKKIANFSLKMPFDMVANIDQNSDFLKLCAEKYVIRTFYLSVDKLIKAVKVACLS